MQVRQFKVGGDAVADLPGITPGILSCDFTRAA